MKLKLTVMKTSSDTRQFVDTKTGQNRTVKISNVLGTLPDGDIVNCRTFADDYQLPKVGSNIEIDMQRYEKKGMVADLMFR